MRHIIRQDALTVLESQTPRCSSLREHIEYLLQNDKNFISWLFPYAENIEDWGLGMDYGQEESLASFLDNLETNLYLYKFVLSNSTIIYQSNLVIRAESILEALTSIGISPFSIEQRIQKLNGARATLYYNYKKIQSTDTELWEKKEYFVNLLSLIKFINDSEDWLEMMKGL